MSISRWMPTWLVLGLALVPLLVFPTSLSPIARDLFLTCFGGFLMLLGTVEAFRRALREPKLRQTWRMLGLVYLVAGLSFGAQAVQGLRGIGLPPHLPLFTILAWIVVCLLLLLIPVGFNRAQSRSRHPWISLLDGAVFTVALNQVLWMWVLQPVTQRVGLPVLHQVGVLLIFGVVAAALGVSLHVLAKRESIKGPVGQLAAALIWMIAFLPWWVRTNFLDELRSAHPFRVVLLMGFLLLWLTVRTPWTAEAPRRLDRPWLMNLLPYLPAVFAFLGALLHDLYFPSSHDRLDTLLLGCLAFLVLLRQVAAFHEIWNLKQNLEEKVEARTRELAESSRLLLQTQRMNLIATLGVGVAHDLNNLIGSARLNLDGLRLEGHPAGGAGEKFLGTLESSLEKAGQLTKRLMAFGAEEPRSVGTVELAAHLQSLNPILRGLVPRSIRLEIAASGEPLRVAGDPGLIDQVVVNLVVNARDATSPGGTISLKAAAVPPAPHQVGWVCLSVEDSGTGIPAEHLPHIFEPFFTTKAAGKGTGLGLGSVKAVVEAMGGSIQVHSVVGQGSRFSVLLPGT